MSSTETTSDAIEALFEAGKRHGVRLDVAERVAVARAIGSTPPGDIRPADVLGAFKALGLPRPTGAYAKTVADRLRQLGPPAPLLEVLLRYRQFAIRSLSGQYGGKTHAHEGELRNSLLTYLPERGYIETPTGRGRTDIVILRPSAVIEVKVWESIRLYEDGLVELGKYIHTERPEQAAMVVFGEAEPLPAIIATHDQAVAERRTLEIPFEIDQPSRAARETRRRNRGG